MELLESKPKTIEVFENALVKCNLDTAIPVLKHRWLKKPTSQEFRSTLFQLLAKYEKFSKEFANLMWLADTQLLGELTEEDEDWLTHEWDELLFAGAGLKRHAVILGQNIFADLPMETFQRVSIKKYYGLGVKSAVFENEASAYVWLKNN